MAKAIYKHNIKLLELCNITEDYPILKDVIKNHPDIEKDDLETISDEYTRFFDNIYDSVLKIAYDEWEGSPEKDIKHYDKAEKRCYICNAKIKNVCTIHNKINGKSIDIGTECNKHFRIYNEKTVNEIIRKQEELSKRNILDRQYPKLSKIIVNWNKVMDESPIYILKKVKDRYLEIKDELLRLYEEYIKKDKIKQEKQDYILKRIGILLEEGIIEKNKINEFIFKNNRNILFPTKKMISTLDKDGIRWIEQDEIIKARTLHKFKDEEFAKKLIDRFNKSISKNELEILSTYRNKGCLGYNIILNKKRDFKLFIEYSEFCCLFGAKITNESELIEKYNEDDVIKECKLIDEKSIDYALYLVKKKLNKYIYDYIYFGEYGDVVWILNKDQSGNKKIYLKTNIETIQDLLKKEVFNKNKNLDFGLYNSIKNNSLKFDKQDIRELFKQRDYDIKDFD